MSDNKIKAIIFDLNGVFIIAPYLSDKFEKKYGVEISKFLPALKDVMYKARRPKAKPAFSYWKPYFDEWKLDLSEEEFFKFWFSGEKENKEMIKLAKEVKKSGKKIFILSNNFKERANYYKEFFYSLDNIFDRVYYSWQTGFVKPDVRAYKNLLNDNNLKPEECIYFDDSEKNIKVAESLGIKSYIFKGVRDVRKIIFN